jgi:FdhD protein
MEEFDKVALDRDARVKTSWLYQLTRKINTTPSLYLKAGAIHGCVLARQDQPLIYMEDVGRHNAVDKIAGYMFLNRIEPHDKIFYTTGRLTSEMVIKTVKMRIPVLVSRSGFTAWGVDLARKAGLTLIGRARGKRFVALSGAERIVFDADLSRADEEDRRHARKGSHAETLTASQQALLQIGRKPVSNHDQAHIVELDEAELARARLAADAQGIAL